MKFKTILSILLAAIGVNVWLQQCLLTASHNNSAKDGKNERTKFEEDDDNRFNNVLDELDEITRGTNYTLDSQNCLAPKKFYHNRIVRSDKGNNKKLIPKIIHVGFKERCLPQDLYRFMERWEETFPEYSIFLHDAEATEKLFYRETYPEFPNFHRILKCVFYNGAMSADIWRVLVLWLYGGIYTDIDVYPNMFKDSTIPDDANGFYFSQPRNWVSHWFQAIEPKHRMMFDCMKTMIHNIYNKIDVMNPAIFQHTGPWVIRDAFNNFVTEDAAKIAQKLKYREPANFSGMDDQKIVKVNKDVTNRYVTHKKGYQDLVPHPLNETMGIKRAERINIESGFIHWPKAQKQREDQLKQQGIQFHKCKDYLKVIEEDPSKEIPKVF